MTNRLVVGALVGALVSVANIEGVSADTHSVTVTVRSVDAQGIGASMGTIALQDSSQGMRLIPNLTGLTPGEHGFHIHENPDCGPKEKDGKMVAALAAGGHYDPHSTGKHMGPHGGGHHGDLPVLIVDSKGAATQAVEVKGVKVDSVRNRSIMIHAGGDNYADAPAPLGGGGARVACGVIPKSQ